MSEAPEKLVLAYTGRIDAEVDRVIHELHDIQARLTNLEEG